jgi:hypothetical protein
MGTSTVAQNSKIYSFDATFSQVVAPAPALAPATEIIRDIAAPQHYSIWFKSQCFAWNIFKLL